MGTGFIIAAVVFAVAGFIVEGHGLDKQNKHIKDIGNVDVYPWTIKKWMEEAWYNGMLLVFLEAIAVVLFTTGMHYKTNPHPITPLDVYRGKTELMITSSQIDSTVVKSDTVVVWKEEYK